MRIVIKICKRRRPSGRRRASCYRSCARLELHDILRRRTLLSLHDVELDPLALGERLEPLCLDRGVVHEAVLLAVLGRDETKALRVVEPLHDAGNACHARVLAPRCCSRWRADSTLP